MQLNVNGANPSFGYFNFNDAAAEHFKRNIKAKDLEKFKEVVQKEEFNKNVEASVYYINGHFKAWLRTLDSKGNPIAAFCKDLGSQGFFKRMRKGTVAYLEEISKASSNMLDKYNLLKKS